MVSYYNPLAMYPKSHCANLYPGANPWYPSNYQPPNAQLFVAGGSASGGGPDADGNGGGGGGGGQPPMYYPHMFHQSSSPDWHESFSTPPTVNGGLIQAAAGAAVGTPVAGHHHHHPLHHHHHHHANHHQSGSSANSEHLNDGLHSIPSPPITVSGSEMSSPGGGTTAGNSASNNGLHGGGGGGGGGGSASPHHNMSMRPVPVKSPFEWIKRTSYQNQTNPGKTRTKDKYRVVYTDYQRLELEKEYHTSRYITIRRKTELAQNLSLSERQVKIWFQNRRAKERKQTKKRDDVPLGMSQHHGIPSILDIKPKQEPDLHLQHPALHQMSAMMHSSYPHHVAVAAGLRLGPPLPPASALSSSSGLTATSSHTHNSIASHSSGSGASGGHSQHPSGLSI